MTGLRRSRKAIPSGPFASGIGTAFFAGQWTAFVDLKVALHEFTEFALTATE